MGTLLPAGGAPSGTPALPLTICDLLLSLPGMPVLPSTDRDILEAQLNALLGTKYIFPLCLSFQKICDCLHNFMSYGPHKTQCVMCQAH